MLVSSTRCEERISAIVPADFSSNLPIIEVDTEGAEIPDEPKIPARVHIYDNPRGRTRAAPSHVVLETLVGIEVRGDSSQRFFPKKQYGFQFQRGRRGKMAYPVLSMPKGSDWILYGPFSDKSHLRNLLTYHLSNEMGQYATRGQFVELFLRQGGDPSEEEYRGVYLVTEKITRGKQRVDISRKSGELGDETGYILKIDRLDSGANEFYFLTSKGTRVISVYPRSADLSEYQKTYLKEFFDKFDSALHKEHSGGEGGSCRDFLDVDSLVDYMILNELAKNVDAFRFSTFMHMDKGGKLEMGPVWDFNQAYGNSVFHSRSAQPRGWLIDLWDEEIWWKALIEDPDFLEEYTARWKDLRGTVLADNAILSFIDANAILLEEAQKRNFSRWKILGKYVFGNSPPYPKSFHGEVVQLKDWILTRTQWIDAHIDSIQSRDSR